MMWRNILATNEPREDGQTILLLQNLATRTYEFQFLEILLQLLKEMLLVAILVQEQSGTLSLRSHCQNDQKRSDFMNQIIGQKVEQCIVLKKLFLHVTLDWGFYCLIKFACKLHNLEYAIFNSMVKMYFVCNVNVFVQNINLLYIWTVTCSS